MAAKRYELRSSSTTTTTMVSIVVECCWLLLVVATLRLRAVCRDTLPACLEDCAARRRLSLLLERIVSWAREESTTILILILILILVLILL